MTETIKKQKAASIAGRLVETAGCIRFGSVSVTLKVHNGRIVDVTHTVTESSREKEAGEVDA